MALTVPHARRWFPWHLGEPVLYRAVTSVTVRGRESSRVEDAFGFRDVSVHAAHDEWSIAVNGQPMFLRGANYTPGLRLDQLTEESFAADLQLARDANLDVLRVHAHVLPEEFYRLADEAGMLVIADFPLTLSYAYHATPEEARFFESSVREQVPEMVRLLQNRPSVLFWTAHDDPPWIAANSELADVHAVRQNYTIDHEIKARPQPPRAHRLGRARPAPLGRLAMGLLEGLLRGAAALRERVRSAGGADALVVGLAIAELSLAGGGR